MIKELLNSAIVFVMMFGALFAVMVFIRLFRDEKCKQCGKGRMQEVSTTPLEVNDHNNPAFHGHSTLTVITTVKYQCPNCGAFYQVHENR